ncbi:unnamed protein product, partial [Choristocarpus tenellus]
VVTVEGGFQWISTKFELNDGELSKVATSATTLEVWIRGVGKDEEDTLLGSCSIQLFSVLQGRNECSSILPLGCYVQPPAIAASEPQETDESESGRQVQREEDQAEETEQEVDESPGLLQVQGSTSTMQVTLLTDDDTADYTVGGTLVWTESARVTGLPEAWKFSPNPETERSEWQEKIAEKLAGAPMHKYTLSWPVERPVKETVQQNNTQPSIACSGLGFPFMQLNRGALSYKPDLDPENEKKASVASLSSGSELEAGGEEGEESTPLPPPGGTWSIVFPANKSLGVFLHRNAVRDLRQALLTARDMADDNNIEGRDGNKRRNAALLPVLLERYPCPPPPMEGEPKAKKGKKAGDKTALQAETPQDKPWVSVAWIDISVLVGSNGEENGPMDADLDSLLVPINAEQQETKTAFLKNILDTVVHTLTHPDSITTLSSPPFLQCLHDVVHLKSLSNNGTNNGEVKAEELGDQIEQMAASGTTLELPLRLTRPLFQAPVRQEKGMSVNEIFVPKDMGPSRKPSRDAEKELKEEIDAFITAILHEYTKLFMSPGKETEENTAMERQKRLFYTLNTGGVYHSFRERLKPRIQRVVKKMFGAAPTPGGHESDDFVAKLYAYLVEQATIVLNQKIRDIEAKATSEYLPRDEKGTLEERVEELEMLAMDAEAQGSSEEARARHEDRIEAATAVANIRQGTVPLRINVEDTLFKMKKCEKSGYRVHQKDYAHYSLRNGTLDRAVLCFEESLSVSCPGSDSQLDRMARLAAVFLEIGQFEKARTLLEEVQDKRLPEVEVGEEGYNTDQLSKFVPSRVHALCCLLRDVNGEAQGARRSLYLGVAAMRKEERENGGDVVEERKSGAPRRTAVYLMHNLCTWLLELRLVKMARRAYNVAEESERVTIRKAQERGLPTRTPTSLRESSRRLRCLLTIAE